MKHLDQIHTDRFYTKLVHEGKLIEERATGTDEDGDPVEYWGFDDAEEEAEDEGATLDDHGTALYFFEGKVYEVVVYLPNNEGTGVNEYEADDIDDLIKRLIEENEENGDDLDDFHENHPWAQQFMASPEPQQVNMKFTGNFGTLNLTVESDGYAMGQYQDGGMLEGDLKDGVFEGEWRNKGMEGLIKFTIADGKLEGAWKKGLEPGAMRGKWKGELIEKPNGQASPSPTPEATEAQSKEDLVPKIIEALIEDLDKYQFYHFGPMLHHLIEEVGPELVGKAIEEMVEKELHYNLHTGIKHLYDKWGNDDEAYFEEHPNLTDSFIEDYIEQHSDRLPNLRRHITRKAQQNFGEMGAVWAMKNGWSGYLVKDPEDWTKLKGPVGLAVRLCGCESFDQVVETEAVNEFQHHFCNIFFYSLKEIEELPPVYHQHLKAMLLTSIDALYHDDPDWNLEKAPGVLTQAVGMWLNFEYGQDFNAYIQEEPIGYGGEELALFGVAWLSGVEYPVNYDQMAADLLALAL